MDEADIERQPACKPGSVWPELSPRRDGHSSGTPVAGRLEQPTRATGPTDKAPRAKPARRSYSVLLPAGLALPPTLPPARCALTAPFHPYPDVPLTGASGRFAFCGAFPGVAPAGRYPAPRPYGARTFLRFEKSGGRPADWLDRTYERWAAAVKEKRETPYSGLRPPGSRAGSLAKHSTVAPCPRRRLSGAA